MINCLFHMVLSAFCIILFLLPKRAVTRPLLKNRDNVFLINFVDAQRPNVRIHVVSRKFLQSAYLVRLFVLSFFLGDCVSANSLNVTCWFDSARASDSSRLRAVLGQIPMLSEATLYRAGFDCY